MARMAEADIIFSLFKKLCILLLLSVITIGAIQLRPKFPVPHKDHTLEAKYSYKTYYFEQNVSSIF
jgi:hypothetical protein